MKKIILSLIALGALSGAAFAAQVGTNNYRSDHEKNRGHDNYQMSLHHIIVSPTSGAITSAFEIDPNVENIIDLRKIHRMYEKNGGKSNR